MAEQLLWISPASVNTKLDGTDTYYYLSLIGRQGIFDAPKNFIAQPLPLQHGDHLLRVLAGVNNPRVPLLVKGSSETNLIAAIRNLRTQMNALSGNGTLQYTAYDGVIRQLPCRLLSGIEGDESQGNRGPSWIIMPLIFQADDPFWYDQAATTNTYTTFGGFTITNTGDVEMWPKWTINGPLTSLTLTNSTTGQAFTITLAMGNSDVLTIDTTPGVKTILLNGTTNEYSALSISSVLWSFATGSNSVAITIAGTGGSTSIQLSYKQRYLGV